MDAIVVTEKGIVDDWIEMQMPENIKPFISRASLLRRIEALAVNIAQDYDEINAIVVLHGAKVFYDILKDFLLAKGVKVNYHEIGMSSYKGTESTGDMKFYKDIDSGLENKKVLVVEDIVDTGQTLLSLKNYLTKKKKAKIMETVALFDKPSRRKVDIKADYVGFEIPDMFIVGFGLDYDGKYRELPFLGIVTE